MSLGVSSERLPAPLLLAILLQQPLHTLVHLREVGKGGYEKVTGQIY